MKSPFGAAFDKLPRETQVAISKQLQARMWAYRGAFEDWFYSETTRVVIIGDTPGPKRPSDPNYHHTPFYSTKNCSLWMNRMLVEAGIDEEKLLWFNSTLASGEKLDPMFISDLLKCFNNLTFIVLGGNAENWFKKASPGTPYVKVYHPQFAKRFKSKEPYALIDEIKKALQE